MGASLELGEEPARRSLPTAPELRLDALVSRLSAAAGQPILLLLDEIQTLGDAPDGDRVIAALRAVLHKRRKILKSVFTGSSQEAMVRMLSTAGAPMYQFAQLLDFPFLGDEYLRQLADHFAAVHPAKRLALADLQRLYAGLGFKPGLVKDVVKEMSAEGLTDVDVGRKRFVHARESTWRALMQPYDLFDRAVLLAVAKGLPPLGRDTLAMLHRVSRERATVSRVRNALERLRRAALVTKTAAATAMIEDPLFAEYLKTRSIEDLI